MFGAAMPEAAVDEDCHSPSREGDIGVDYPSRGQSYRKVLPEPEAVPMQKGAERDFGLRVRPAIGLHSACSSHACRRWVWQVQQLSVHGLVMFD